MHKTMIATFEAVLDTASAFARDELRPVALHYDETEEYPLELLHRAAALGLTCYDLPADYGGGGVTSLRARCAVIEELSWGDSPIFWVIAQGGFFAGPVLALGSAEQKERWLPPLCGPEPPACAVAITEPEHGSDAAAIETTARRVDGGYVLDRPQEVHRQRADRGRLCGVRDRRAGKPLARDHRIRRRARRRGLRPRRTAAEAREPVLPGGRAPLRRVLRPRRPPPRRRGAGVQRAAARVRRRPRAARRLDARRRTRGARARGRVRDRSARRSAGAIHEFQAVSFRLADAKLKLDQARLLTHHAADLADAGAPFSTEAAMAKLAASEASWFSTWAAAQTLGGAGYVRDSPVQKWLRDAKLDEIWDGTSDIMRLIIARSLFPKT